MWERLELPVNVESGSAECKGVGAYRLCAIKSLLVIYDQLAVFDGDAFYAWGQAKFFVILGRRDEPIHRCVE